MTSEDRQSQVRIRRAPKYSAFMIVGGAVGAIVTLVVTSLYPADPSVGYFALFGYFALYGVPAGVLAGALLAILLDRVSTSRARTADVVVEKPPVSKDARGQDE